MEVSAKFQPPKDTEWDKIEHYVDADKLKRMLLNKFRDPKKHEPKYKKGDDCVWVLMPQGERLTEAEKIYVQAD